MDEAGLIKGTFDRRQAGRLLVGMRPVVDLADLLWPPLIVHHLNSDKVAENVFVGLVRTNSRSPGSPRSDRPIPLWMKRFLQLWPVGLEIPYSTHSSFMFT